MADEKRWLKKLINELLKRLSKEFDVDKIVLFGSYAWGKPTRYSDLDIAVISKSFRTMDDIERIIALTNCARRLPLPRPIGIDIVGFTPKEFKSAGYFDLAGEIKERGKVVYTKAA